MYDRQKLIAGLTRACEKCAVSNVEIEDLISSIERELHSTGEPEVSSRQIGEMVMERLAMKDEVAYVRFASVYREFRDISSFQDELNRLKKGVASGK